MERGFRLQLNRKFVACGTLLSLVILIVTGIIYHTLTHANPGPQNGNIDSKGAAAYGAAVQRKQAHNKSNDKHTTAVTAGSKIQTASSLSPQALSSPALSITNTSSAALSVYNGPGAIGAHGQFEQWLGRSIPYATDYIDYKGGWQQDFVDSQLWLMQPWGRWVRQAPGRRLVLGLPMLENANSGQFAQGVSGAFDTYFASLGNELVQNGLGNTIIRLGYEANCNTIGPWQATDNPDGYRQLFRHIVSVMRNTPGSSFSFDWTACNGLQNGHALNSFDSFYPGDDVVDIIGIDIYDVKWVDTSVTPQARWGYITGRQMGVNELAQFARSHGKSFSIPEWGLYKPGDNYGGGGDDPYFIQKMAALINATNPLYQSYFDVDWGGGVIQNFPQGAAAYKAIYGQ